MAEEYLAIYEEDVRGTPPASPDYLFLPVHGNLQPRFEPTDEPRKEYRGIDTALGDFDVVRRMVQWSHTLEFYDRPIKAVGLLLKHALGYAGARAVVDTTARRGILYPHRMPFGDGPLGSKAIALVANTSEGGVTKAQTFGGGRITGATLSFEESGDVKWSLEIKGSWVGTPDQVALTPSMPAITPFNAADVLCFIGAGAARTGTAPNYTNIAQGSMQQFGPDSVTITVTNGLDDKFVRDGAPGPNKTHRSEQFNVEVACPIDYEDPSSGFSSADEFKRLFAGVATQSLMFVMQHPDTAGSTDEKYRRVIDIPRVQLGADPPERSVDGLTPTVTFNYTRLLDATIKVPLLIMSTDQEEAY